MKRSKNIIFVFLICVSIFFTIDFLQFKIIEKNFYKNFQNLNIKTNSYFKYYDNNWFIHSITSYKNYYEKLIKNFRGDIIEEKNTKRPIIIFGCSFAYGTQLEEKATFAYKIAKLTKRNVFNRAIQCCGIQHMYYLLTHSKFYDTLPKNPEYVIFVYISSQLTRLHNYIFPSEMLVNGPYLQYKIENHKLKIKKEIPFIYKSFLVKKLLAKIDEKNSIYTQQTQDRIDNMVRKLFVESKNLLQEKYPDIKFVILKYNSETSGIKTFENPKLWEKLKDDGFIIINSDDITGKFYMRADTTEDNIHPNEAAWDLLVPKFVEKLNL